jgi:predicted DNA-binding transcriptional regulator AlpA
MTRSQNPTGLHGGSRQPVPPPRLLDAEQAATYLGLKTRHALALIPVRPLKIGSLVRWDRCALDAWLDVISGLEASLRPTASATPNDAEDALRGWLADGGAGAAPRRT